MLNVADISVEMPDFAKISRKVVYIFLVNNVSIYALTVCCVTVCVQSTHMRFIGRRPVLWRNQTNVSDDINDLSFHVCRCQNTKGPFTSSRLNWTG